MTCEPFDSVALALTVGFVTPASAHRLRLCGGPVSDRFPSPDGAEWLVVTTAVEDPEYPLARFVTSSHVRRETDASTWSPRPCKPV